MRASGYITTDVSEAVQVLLSGGIIGLPTETVYGLAAVAENQTAVMRVFSTKGRPTHHPLIVHLGTSVDVNEWGVMNADAMALAKAFWPGPLTLLVPRTQRVRDWVTGGRDTVALRVPSHPVAQRLLNDIATGLVAPSANRFGKVSPTTAQHVIDDLGEDVDLVLEGGPSSVGLESTIVECIDDNVVILRPGVISADDIRRVIPHAQSRASGESRAPGMMASHYAPSAEVQLFEDVDEAKNAAERFNGEGKSAIVVHRPDLEQFAECLYSDFRQADDLGVDVICAVLPPETGIGIAIRDRLKKAAHR